MLHQDVAIVSVDDHIIEPPNLWLDRLPAAQQEGGPHVVQGADGGDLWLYDGRPYAQGMLSAVAGWDVTEWRQQPFRYADMRPGCYDSRARLVDMDTDGVHAGVTGPTVPRIGGSLFLEGTDRALALACVRAWNDFVLDEWCPVAPDRFIPTVIVPLWDVQLAVAEIERTASRGARMVNFVDDPAGLGLPSFYTSHWDPFFAAVQHADLALSMHFGGSLTLPFPIAEAPFVTTQVLLCCNSMAALTHLVFARVPQRFPRVRFVMSESGIGWVPFILERLDLYWLQNRHHQDLDLQARPSDLYREHFWMATILSEAFGLGLRQAIGVDRILLQADYPHADSRFPNTRAQAESLLADVPDGEARAIAETNARTVLRFG